MKITKRGIKALKVAIQDIEEKIQNANRKSKHAFAMRLGLIKEDLEKRLEHKLDHY